MEGLVYTIYSVYQSFHNGKINYYSVSLSSDPLVEVLVLLLLLSQTEGMYSLIIHKLDQLYKPSFHHFFCFFFYYFLLFFILASWFASPLKIFSASTLTSWIGVSPLTDSSLEIVLKILFLFSSGLSLLCLSFFFSFELFFECWMNFDNSFAEHGQHRLPLPSLSLLDLAYRLLRWSLISCCAFLTWRRNAKTPY